MPRVLGILGATAVAMSVLTPTAAHAAHFTREATNAQWDQVAQCESGGNWHLNTGNGYYGGLQMSKQTWASFGGHRYARRPDLTSRSNQIDVANRVYAADGWTPWRRCAPNAKRRG